VACYVYFLVGAYVNALFFKPLIAAVYQQVREGGREEGREGGKLLHRRE